MIKNYKKVILLTVLLSCVSFSAFAKKTKVTDAKLTDITVVEGFSSPESVVVAKDCYYVSNVGKKLEPSTKDGDGFISKISKDGKILELNFFPSEKLDAPKGMSIINNILYVADIDRVLGFDLKTKQKKLEIKIPNTNFLNDICKKDKNSFFVSSTDLGKIFQIDITKKTATELQTTENLAGVNGLFYRNNKLFFNTFGDGKPDSKNKGFVGVISFKKDKTKVIKLPSLEGSFDGLFVFKNTSLIVSDWDKGDKGGRLVIVDKKGKNKDLKTTEIIKGPADFCYDESNKTLIIPAMMENKLLFKKLDF